jgi:two-component system OmpR family sensor kinase
VPIRVRLALVFTILAAVAFSAAGYLFETSLSSRLRGLLDVQLTVQLDQVSHNIAREKGNPEPAGPPRTSAGPSPGEYLYQLLDASGHVRGTSADAGSTGVLNLKELRLAQQRQVFFTKQLENEHVRLTADPYLAHSGWVEVAGASLESVDRTISNVTSQLLIGGLVGIVVAGLGAYMLARGALSPVERMRREVAALSERDSGARIEVPSTKDEIASLAVTMNGLLGRLHQALVRQRGFVADAGHELRTPFAVLRAELELAARPGRSVEELTDAIHNASEEAARLSRLADDLLLLARSDDDHLSLQIEQTDLADLLGRSASRARVSSDGAEVGCRVEVPSGLTVALDPHRMRQAIDNLVDNARRFGPTGSDIVISALVEDETLQISVTDSGPGFPDEFLAHAFERFRRPDSVRSRSEGGAGLGLAIVKAIALAHGGDVIAANQDQGGAVVTITIPTKTPKEPVSPS